ncbi:hypothetical protein UlMin_008206 [Ulmus minor]
MSSLETPQILGDPYWVIKPLSTEDSTSPSNTFKLDFQAELACPLYQFSDEEEEELENYRSCNLSGKLELPFDVMMDDLKAEAAIAAMFEELSVPPPLQFLVEDIIENFRSMTGDDRGLFTYVHVFVDRLPLDHEDMAMDDDDDVRVVAASKEFIEGLERQKVEDSDIVCSVCLEDVLKGSEAIGLPCSHLYHGDCIVEWLQRSNDCPLCRLKMPNA